MFRNFLFQYHLCAVPTPQLRSDAGVGGPVLGIAGVGGFEGDL